MYINFQKRDGIQAVYSCLSGVFRVFWGYQENQISSKNFKDKCRQFLSQKLYIMHGIVAYFLLPKKY